MLLLDTVVNYTAVLAAAAASMVIGFLWYRPKKKGMAKAYGLMTIGALVSAFVLAHFVNFAAAYTPLDGALVGFWLWLGFVVPMMAGNVLFAGEPVKLYLIKVSHVLVGMLAMGAILAVWV